MKKLTIVACVAISALMAACGTSKKAQAPYMAGEWNIVSVKGVTIDTTQTMKAPFIGFDRTENRVYGSASCNSFFAGMELDSINSKIKFGQAGATRMMCPNMEIEDAILSVLDKVSSYQALENGDVQLSDDSNGALMVIRKKN